MSPDRLGIARKKLWISILAISLSIGPAILFASAARADDDALQIGAEAERQQGLGNYKAAAKLYERAVELAPQAFGADHLYTAGFCNNLAATYDDLGEYAKAEPLYQRALKIREKIQGENGPLVADTLNNLGALYVHTGEAAKAEPVFLRCIKAYAANNGRDDPSVAIGLCNLGIVEERLGEYSQAEQLFNASLGIRTEKRLSVDIAETEFQLGNLYRKIGDYTLAELNLLTALHMYEANRPADHPDIAPVLNDLGILYCATGQYDKAEPLFQRALKICEDKIGPDSPAVARELDNLGKLRAATNQFAQAASLYSQSLRIDEAKLGPNHPNLTPCIDNLAWLSERSGRFAEAESLRLRSLRISESSLGPDHPDVAKALTNLAMLYQTRGQFEKAEPLFQRAIKIFTAHLNGDLDAAKFPLHYLAVLHASEGRFSDAAAEFDRSRRIVRRHVAGNLLTLGESDQLNFLQFEDAFNFQTALSFGLQNRGDAAIAERSAAWLLNGKLVAQEALTQCRRLAKDVARQPMLAYIIQEEQQSREKLASDGSVSGQESNNEKRRKDSEQLAAWEHLHADFSKVLVLETLKSDPWVELSALRKVIPKNSLVIDIARFPVWDFGDRARPTQCGVEDYAAWIIPAAGQGRIEIIDLGEAERIDEAIRAARRAFQSPNLNLGTPTNGKEKSLRAPNKQASVLKPATAPSRGIDLGPASDESEVWAVRSLAKLILDPLQSHFGKADGLIISPDSDLWLVPWAALPLADGTLAIEKYKISYTVSGRELVRPPLKDDHPPKPTVPVLFANPDYDLSPDNIVARTRDVLREESADEPALVPWNGILQTISKVARLPGTAAEARAIEPKVKEWCHADPVAYTGAYALEGVFKRLNSPRVLVLSTHGFVLADQTAAHADDKTGGLVENRSVASISIDGQPLQDPMLRCGLLLAGCNSRLSGTINPSADDGILTGAEIADTDLRSTELVVLSACDTGLGDIHNGEGVAGLRQAFQLAGAKAVVATLWEIPDQETATLMSDFFANLAAGQSKADALRDAQLKFIKSRREKYGSAPPFYWAAFTLTGQD